MNRLGYKSRRELLGVHPDLIIVVTTAIITLPKGCDASVFDGVRTRAEQAENVRRGVSKTMRSNHLPQEDGYGHAADILPYLDGRVWWDSKDKKMQTRIDTAFNDILVAMKRAAELHDVEVENGYELWGWDRPHFQLSNIYRS